MAILSLIFMATLAAQGVGETGSAPPQASAQPAAAASSATPAKLAKPVKSAGPKKICVDEPQLGSHFSRRLCATPAEWEKRRERDAEMMSRGSDNVGPGSQTGP